MQGRILVIDDEKRLCTLLKTAIESPQLAVATANTGESALAAFELEKFDIVISDIKMPGLSGLDVLEHIKRISPETEVLLMTAYAETQTAVQAMKMGAFDYLIKPFEMDELSLKIEQILEKQALKQENQNLRQQVQHRFSLDNMVGKSGAMQRVYELVHKVANSDATVLIRGESGTGKELIAKALHFMSQRKEHPFFTVNCGALPDNLLESELFGHEKGAFTGADKEKPGQFELANKGTLFLDEIGELTLPTQVKLLRVLQSHEILRLGGTRPLRVEARVISATNRPLESMVKEKTFREDLYYRINVFPITLPPLRDRRQDIPELVSHFLVKQNHAPDGIQAKALNLLMDYPWPGNVRELENVIERALILASGQPIQPNDLPPHIRGEAETPLQHHLEEQTWMTLDEMEKRLIVRSLQDMQGNKTEAAKRLGITRRQLYSKVERLFPGGFQDIENHEW
ncbi:response regulator [candidate division KSB1 bacterium]|nr:response regulator [candidate division KSB1 bacterium]